MKQKQPDTSLAAYRQLTKEQKDRHHARIISAFEVLGQATADKIAEFTGLDHVQVNRRFCELVRDEKIISTKMKLPTRRGRDAFVYTLCTTGVRTDNERREGNEYKKGTMTSTDHSKKLLQTIQLPLL